MKCGTNGKYYVHYAIIRLLLEQGQYDRTLIKPNEDIIKRKNRDKLHYYLEEAQPHEYLNDYRATYQSISNIGIGRFTVRDAVMYIELNDKATDILKDESGLIFPRFGKLFPKWAAARATNRIHIIR